MGGLLLFLVAAVTVVFFFLFSASSKGPEKAERLMRHALSLREQGRHNEAEAPMRAAILGEQEVNGPLVGPFATQLALLYQFQGRFADATSLFQHALELNVEQAPADAVELLPSFAYLGINLVSLKKYDEAEPYLRQALEIGDNNRMSVTALTMVTVLSNLAIVLQETGRHNEAEPLFRRAIALDEAEYGHGDPRVAAGLERLSWTLMHLDRVAEAEQLMRRALSIDEVSFGATSMPVVMRLANLAHIMRVANRNEDARGVAQRALAIVEKNPDGAEELAEVVRGLKEFIQEPAPQGA